MKLTVPAASKLKRDRSNWNIWMRLCRDMLQASGDWRAITEDYSNFESDSGSDEDITLDVGDDLGSSSTPVKQEGFGKQLKHRIKQSNKRKKLQRLLEK